MAKKNNKKNNLLRQIRKGELFCSLEKLLRYLEFKCLYSL